MKGQILISGKKNKKSVTNLLSAEFTQRLVKVNLCCSLGKNILYQFNGLSFFAVVGGVKQRLQP